MKIPGLCEVCLGCLVGQKGLQDVADDQEPGTTLYFAHKSSTSLVDSSDSGCTICRILWRQLSQAQKAAVQKFKVKESLSFLLIQPSTLIRGTTGWLLSAWIESDAKLVEGEPEPEILLFLLQTQRAEGSIYSVRPFGDSTESQESWNIAVRWIDNCCNDHTECKAPSSISWHPTRLLDIGSKPSDRVRLIHTACSKPTDEYVTLSHCWGDSPIFKLNRTTYKYLTDGIEASQLSLTFQHAITITRRLSKRLLWIDSLCIFQDDDDKSDWLREARLMDRVYSQAYLNISATGAKDGTAGLFVSRDPDFELTPTTFPWYPPSNTPLKDGQEDVYVLTEMFFLNRQLMHEPIHQRAWVLQERLLAKRVLHFGTSQLFWECNHGVLCERFPDRLPAYMTGFGPATFKSYTRAYNDEIIPTTIGGRPEPKVFKLWDKVVDAYSNALLTYPSDKLIALSGIAKVMRDIFQDEYVAGMWRSCLESQLLWAVNDAVQVNGQASTRNFAYRAPTWSWMSVEGKVTAGFSSHNALWIDVIDVSLEYANEDTTGILTGGYLTLRGRLRPLRLRRMIAALDDEDPESQELRRRVEEKGLSLKDFEKPVPGQWVMTVNGKDLQLSNGTLWERMGPIVSLDVDQPDFDESNEKAELYMMSARGPGVNESDPYSNPTEASPYHDILLLKCVNPEKGVFHRFGKALLDTRKEEIFSYLQEYDQNEADMPSVAYDALPHLHTIILE